MPLTIPAFQQYQEPMTPLAARWRMRPPEGDKSITMAIDWGTMGGAQKALQAGIGNNPQEFSQIVALYVDNRRCGVDVAFVFPDTGFLLEVPAHDQGLYPVLTNAQQFYVVGTGAVAGDTTIAQILNSLPPPISILPATQQSTAAVVPINLALVAVTQLVPATISGTLNSLNMTFAFVTAGGVNLSVQDGTGAAKWSGFVQGGVNSTVVVDVSNINARFVSGLAVNIGASTATGSMAANAYYQTP